MSAIVSYTGKPPQNAALFSAYVRWLVGDEFDVRITLKARTRFMAYGAAHAEKHGHTIQRDRSYLVHFIALKGLDAVEDSLRILAHEITHVLQLERGHLRLGPSHFIWHGARYIDFATYKAATPAVHASLPWEAEANDAMNTKPAAFIAYAKAGGR